jgi:hypothetical protein
MNDGLKELVRVGLRNPVKVLVKVVVKKDNQTRKVVEERRMPAGWAILIIYLSSVN